MTRTRHIFSANMRAADRMAGGPKRFTGFGRGRFSAAELLLMSLTDLDARERVERENAVLALANERTTGLGTVGEQR